MKLIDKKTKDQKINDFYDPDYNEPMTVGEFIEDCLGIISIFAIGISMIILL